MSPERRWTRRTSCLGRVHDCGGFSPGSSRNLRLRRARDVGRANINKWPLGAWPLRGTGPGCFCLALCALPGSPSPRHEPGGMTSRRSIPRRRWGEDLTWRSCPHLEGVEPSPRPMRGVDASPRLGHAQGVLGSQRCLLSDGCASTGEPSGRRGEEPCLGVEDKAGFAPPPPA